MNVRFDDQSIRFRITQVELNSLRNGAALFEEVSADQGCFQFEISPNSNVQPMSLFWEGKRMVLAISNEALDELHNRGRSREGLSSSQDSIEICLEVDILSDKRRKIITDKNAMPQTHPLDS